MKRIRYKLFIGGSALVLLAIIYSCGKNFLHKPALGALSPSSLGTPAGVQAILIGAYSMLDGEGGAQVGTTWGAAVSNWTYGGVAADEAYKGSIPTDQFVEGLGPISLWTVDGSDPYLEQKWQAVYDGAQRANDVIRVMRTTPGFAPADTVELVSEARFLRGIYHFEAKKVFGNPIYVDETVTVGNNNYNVANDHDIWPQIEADFQYAVDHLPETQPQAGRANKWAAVAFLAKAYMYERKYTQAKTLLDQLIASGKTANGQKYALVNYENNFNAATKNSAESVFACQMSVNDGSGTNGNYGDNLNFPNSGGPGGCCGFNNPSISLANAYKTDAVTGLPLLDGSYNSGKVVGDSSNIYIGTLDPRIDWVMGRPGIPYLDWGITPKNAWIRDPATDGFFSPKKNVYASSQAGTLSSTETSFWGPTQIDANNYNFIRYADILLWDAECEIQVGTPATALGYVNQVRTRAGDATGWVYKGATYTASTSKYSPQTTPADNYKIGLYPAGSFDTKTYAMNAIRFEERLEFGMEGHRFFDLQRWDKDATYPNDMAATINTYIGVEKNRPTLFSVNPSAKFTKGKNEIFPIPQKEIDIQNQSGKITLKQNPNY